MAATVFPTKREALGLPDKHAVDLALSFAEIARKDLQASYVVYQKGLYPQSIFDLQQSVEKNVKAMGLLLSLVRPTKEDLAQAGHSTVFSILIRRNNRLLQLRRNLGVLAAAEVLKEGRDLFMKLGLPGTIPESSEMEARRAGEQAANEEVNRLRNLMPRDLWRITLEFNPNRPPNPAILRLLKEAEMQWKTFDRIHTLFEKKLAPLMSDPETLRYVLNVFGKAFPEAAPLAFITSWHERETRYPPLDGTDYWDPKGYKATTGLAKHYPMLYKHAKRFADGTLAGALAAQKI